MQAAQYFDIDPKWVKEKFGIEVLGPKSFDSPLGNPSDNNGKAKNKDKDKNPKEQNSYSPAFDPFV